MAPHMVERFFIRAILVYRPGEKLVKGIARQGRSRQQIGPDTTWFGEHFSLICRRKRGGRLIAPVKRAVRAVALEKIRVRLLVTLQVVPADEDDATRVVQQRRERAAGRVIN